MKTKTNLSLAVLLLSLFSAPGLIAQDAIEKGKVLKREYFFKEAGKNMDYALFVPTKYDKAKRSPLLVLLHGLGSNPHQVIRYQGVREEAEKRGYVVVAPYGYNSRGWYGARGKGKEGAYFGAKGDPDNLGELSEKDVGNVLEIVRKEFSIDPDRIYLAGHSMGGGGTVYLGTKHPDLWAALAPLAPALTKQPGKFLEKIKHVPVMIVTGEKDRLVKVQDVRRWVEEMKKLQMVHTYEEIKGGNHVTSITRNPKMIARMFDFFDKHRRKTGAAAEETEAKGEIESAAQKADEG